MAPSFCKVAPSSSTIITMNEIHQSTSSVSRKRPSSSSSTSSSGSSSSETSLSAFLSSKKTCPQIYSGRAQTSKTPVVPTQVSSSQPAQTDDYFHNLVRTRFPRAVFKHSTTSWKQHYDALVEKENADKLERLVEKSKANATKKVVPDLHPTMALRDQLRAQRLQEAQQIKKNGEEEVKPKKKAVRRQRNTWN